MPPVIELLVIAAGGALGAVSRYGLSVWVDGRLEGRFPAGTLMVNVLGCLALGALMAVAETHSAVSPRLRLFLGVGLLGAFTTFSTLGVETLALLREGRPAAALISVGLNVALGLAAAALGHTVALKLAG
jgi:CrcB protein